MKGFTKCANGHYYKEELPVCPYCHIGGKPAEVVDPKKETQLYTQNKEENKTRLVIPKTPSIQSNNPTIFGEDVIAELESGKKVIKKEYRSARKLVG